MQQIIILPTTTNSSQIVIERHASTNVAPRSVINMSTLSPITPESVLKDFFEKSTVLIETTLNEVREKYPRMFTP